MMSNTAIKEGCYTSKELSNEAYHADKAIGSSGLKAFRECPKIYEYNYITHQDEDNGTKYTNFGQHAHVALLEPDIFSSRYVVLEDETVTKKTAAAWKQFKTVVEKEGKVPLLKKEFDQLNEMAQSISDNLTSNAYITLSGINEMSFFAKHEASGLMLKARPDRLVRVKKSNLIIDYKTSSISLSSDIKISNHSIQLERHVQAAFHKMVVEMTTGNTVDGVVHIVQMQNAPYLTKNYIMPKELIDLGTKIINETLPQIAECIADNNFPGYDEGMREFTAPNWLLNEMY